MISTAVNTSSMTGASKRASQISPDMHHHIFSGGKLLNSSSKSLQAQVNEQQNYIEILKTALREVIDQNDMV
jgi:hypothetical protein